MKWIIVGLLHTAIHTIHTGHYIATDHIMHIIMSIPHKVCQCSDQERGQRTVLHKQTGAKRREEGVIDHGKAWGRDAVSQVETPC